MEGEQGQQQQQQASPPSGPSGGARGELYFTGYSLRAPSSENPRDFYRNLSTGQDMTTPSRRYPEGYRGLPPRSGTLPAIDLFDHEFFRMSQKQTEKTDIIIRQLLETCQEALMDAKLSTAALRGSNTGVYVGHCFSDFLNRASYDPDLSGYELVNGAHTMAANRLSFHYDFKGPSMAVDSACSSSLVALHMARNDLLNGFVDRAVVCGASLTIDPSKNAVFNAFTMLSPTGECYTFDKRANGYCRSEGIFTIILERADVCGSAGYATLLGTSVNSDGHKDKGITFPSGVDQARNARAAFDSGGVSPDSIAYIEAHGTGTIAGDSQELKGMSHLFYGPEQPSTAEEVKALASSSAAKEAAAGEGGAAAAPPAKAVGRGIPIGSLKSCMGHAEGASGLAAVVKCLMMLEKGCFLPNQRFEETGHEPIADGRFAVVTQQGPWKRGNVCVSNYGFGGTNAFAVLGPGTIVDTPVDTAGGAAAQTPAPAAAAATPAAGLVFGDTSSGPRKCNAKKPDNSGLLTEQQQQEEKEEEEEEEEGGFASEWMTEQVLLGNDAPYRFRNGKRVSSCPRVAFLYGGQGSQWLNMGKRLYSESPVFKATIDRLDCHLADIQKAAAAPSRDAATTLCLADLYKSGDKWLSKEFTSVGIASYQIAATNIFKEELGVVPDHYLGHSLGETAAGYGRGMQTEKETIAIAWVRGNLSARLRSNAKVFKTRRDAASDTALASLDLEPACQSQGWNYFYVTPEQEAADESGGAIFAKKKKGAETVLQQTDGSEETEMLFDLNGQMAAVGLEAGQIQAAIDELGLKETCVACFNSPAGQTVSGAVGEMATLKEALLEKVGPDLFWRALNTDGVAYHAPHLACYYDYLVAEFEKVLSAEGGQASRPFDARWLSTSSLAVGRKDAITGEALADPREEKADYVLDAHYHARNITGPVYFQDAIEALPTNTLVIEVGSSQSLLGQVKRTRRDVSLLGLVSNGKSETEDAYLNVEATRVAMWREGYAEAFTSMRASVDRSSRLPLEKRHPNLWNHSASHRVFTHTDFECRFTSGESYFGPAVGSTGSGGDAAGSLTVEYDVGGADAYLLDHQINGRPLFPATGHLYTMWQATVGIDTGVELTDYEILQAVVMDPAASPKVVFTVECSEGRNVSVSYQGTCVARAKYRALEPVKEEEEAAGCGKFDQNPALFGQGFVVNGKAFKDSTDAIAHFKQESNAASTATAAAAVDTAVAIAANADPRSDEEKAAATSHRLLAPELYNHFKRHGYEYQDEFQLVESRDITAYKGAGKNVEAEQLETSCAAGPRVATAALRPACHIIPFLDNLLQLFFEDVQGLNLPTMIRQVRLHPQAMTEWQEPVTAWVEKATGTVSTPACLMRALVTSAASGRSAAVLTHKAQTFFGLGHVTIENVAQQGALTATVQMAAQRITDYIAAHPDVLADKPWLQNVLDACKPHVGSLDEKSDPSSVAAALAAAGDLRDWAFFRFYDDLTCGEDALSELINNPMITLSLHKEHETFYVDNELMCSSAFTMAQIFGMVRNELGGPQGGTRILEVGAGSCGFARRCMPFIDDYLGEYVCSDISAIRLNELESNPKITTMRQDANAAWPDAVQPFDVIVASNAVHTVKDVRVTLTHLTRKLKPGGMIVLEECIGDQCLFMWGLDKFIWETPTDDRSYGLWMSMDEWRACVNDIDGLEFLFVQERPGNATIVLRKEVDGESAKPVAAAATGADPAEAGNAEMQYDGEFVTSWDQVDLSKAQILVGDGSHAFRRALSMEADTSLLQVLTVDGLDGFANFGGGKSSADQGLPPPKNGGHQPSFTRIKHLTIQNGTVGTTVSVPLDTVGSNPALAASTTVNFAGSSKSTSSIDGDSSGSSGPTGNFALSIPKPGDLSTLGWQELPDTADYDVAVDFSSLNFRDIMYSFGKLKLAKPSLGLEFSGRNTVTGERMMGIGTTSCIAHKVKSTLRWVIPEGMTSEEAATVPVVYLTSAFCLFEKANLQEGQSVLIHAGTGGIGHSAIHLAKSRGLEVFATCAPHKREYLSRELGVALDHIGSSRDPSFREMVMRQTNGVGVDCVLNSLSGDMLDASFECVADFGHFCEIGKMDLQNNTKVGIKALEKNVSYHVVDLATMFEHPRLSGVLKRMMQTMLDRNEVKPLPAKVFGAAVAVDALRYMAAGKHMGKVLIQMGNDFTPRPAAASASLAIKGSSNGYTSKYQASGCHIITGGLGGFGMELARWLLEAGAVKIIVTSRSGMRSPWQRFRFQALLSEYGNESICVSTLDVTDAAQASELVALGAEACDGGLRGIWHSAMVLKDTFFANMTEADWDSVNDAKVLGLTNLDDITRQLESGSGSEEGARPLKLDSFVAFSSIASLLGNIGQTSYSWANNACERVVEARHRDGLAGTAVQWGAIDNVGFFVHNTAGGAGKNKKDSPNVGAVNLGMQNVDDSLNSLHTILNCGVATVSSYRVPEAKGLAGGEGGDQNTVDLAGLCTETVQCKIAEILGGAATDYDPAFPLQEYGLDSLSIVEVVNWINRYVRVKVTPSFINAQTTIDGIHKYMQDNLLSSA